MFKHHKSIPYIETSRWKFENESQSHFNKICSEVVQKEDNTTDDLNQFLEEKMEKLTENLDQMQITEYDSPQDSPMIPEDKSNHVKPKVESKESEKLINLRQLEPISNPYLVLLNRLDEEEGIRASSIDDKLKVTEDRLRLSTHEFCSSCEQLLDLEEQNKLKVYEYLQPQAVTDALRPKVFEPSLRRPQTLHVAEFKKEIISKEDKDTLQTRNATNPKKGEKKHSKKNFYGPPDTWFDHKKHEKQATQEELELLNSTATKAFLKFLNDRKKQPPKILQDIRKKVTDMKN